MILKVTFFHFFFPLPDSELQRREMRSENEGKVKTDHNSLIPKGRVGRILSEQFMSPFPVRSPSLQGIWNATAGGKEKRLELKLHWTGLYNAKPYYFILFYYSFLFECS